MPMTPRRYSAVLLLPFFSSGSWSAGLEEMKLAPEWECKVITEQDDIWLKTYFKGQAQFDYRIGAGGSVAEMQQTTGTAGCQPLRPACGPASAMDGDR